MHSLFFYNQIEILPKIYFCRKIFFMTEEQIGLPNFQFGTPLDTIFSCMKRICENPA